MASPALSVQPPLRRVVVVGSSGAGKTTLAASLAARLGVPHVELDALHWGPNWALPTREAFCARVAAATAGAAWVADGNYSAARDLLWGRAEALVWLDYALPLVVCRLLRRTWRRVRRGEELWNGNRERLAEQFLSHDSLLLHAVRTHARRRRDYPAAYTSPPYAHLRVYRLRSPAEAAAWLAGVPEGIRDDALARSEAWP